MKHTKGPWEVGVLVENDYDPRHVTVLGINGITLIAKAYYGQADEECATNAHLIAAAPELLEACIAARNKLDELDQDADREGTNIFVAEEMDILEKAINRTEGK